MVNVEGQVHVYLVRQGHDDDALDDVVQVLLDVVQQHLRIVVD